MSRLSGRFTKIEKVGNRTIVGLLGTIKAKSLSDEEKRYIAGFYNIKGNCTFSVVDKYKAMFSKICTNNYNDFLVIEEVN